MIHTCRFLRLVAPATAVLFLSNPAQGEPAALAASSSTTPLAILRNVDDEPDALAVSPDGSLLLSASGRELLVWDLKSNRPLRSLKLPNQLRDYSTCAFSPDGSTIAAASNDGMIGFWQSSTGALLKTLTSEDWMYDCAFSADLGTAVCGYQSGKVTFRNLQTGAVLWSRKNDNIKVCSFSSRASRALTVGEMSATLWDTSSGKELRSYSNVSCRLHRTAALSPDGRLIATAKHDDTSSWSIVSSTILLIDAASGKPIHTLKGHRNGLRSFEFSPDGSVLASCSMDNHLKLWNLSKGTLIRTYQGHDHDVSRATFFPDGSKVVSASKDLSLKIWDARRDMLSPEERASIMATQARLAEVDRRQGYIEPVLTIPPTDSKFGIDDCSFSPDGKTLMALSDFAPITIRDSRSGKVRFTYKDFPSDASPLSCAFAPDGKRALCTGRDGSVKIWNISSGKTLLKIPAHSSYVMDAAFSPDGTRIVSASWDKTAAIWNATTGKKIARLKGFSDDLERCVFIPGKDAVVISSKDNTARMFNASDGTPMVTFHHNGEPTYLAASPDGRSLFTACRFEPVQSIWNLETGKRTRRLGPPSWIHDPLRSLGSMIGVKGPSHHYVHCVAYSPDGRWIATGTLHHDIRILDAATGSLRLTVRTRAGHSESIDAISFSPDCKRLLTGSGDGSLKIWDFQQILATIPPGSRLPDQ